MNRLSLTLIPLLGSLLILPSAQTFPNFFSRSSNPIIVANALSSITQIRQLAKDTTVKVIAAKKHGSGVLIDKQGHTYTVVTNAHVITASGTAQIQTPDGKIYQALVKQRGSSLQGNDLAVLQFQSQENYRVVPLAPESKVSENQQVYAAGFAYDSPGLVFTSGKISLIAPKPLVGGYQIGYTNEIKQGMSGGPLLNSEGKLIGINGLLASAILNDAYIYQDGSQPNPELQQRLRATSFAVPSQTLAQVAPELAVIPREWRQITPPSSQPAQTGFVGEIDRIAGEITMRIVSKENGNGSGVMIAHQGQTYYVLTAFHVVKNPDEYTVVTPDGEKHPVTDKDIVKENGLDVAILKFTSTRQYTVATLARYNLSDAGQHWIFFSGFPGGVPVTTRKLSPGFRFNRDEGFLQAKDTVTELSNGYELVYTNISLPGMSGGPLLDTQGRVIGIGGRQEGEPYSEKFDRSLGYALGVPISTGLGLASRTAIKPEWMKIETALPSPLTPTQLSSLGHQFASTAQPPPQSKDENEWLDYGNQLWRLLRPEEAVAALKQAIQLNPDFYQAYYVLGLVQESQGKYQAAVATFKQVTQLHPDYYQAWREQGALLKHLKQYPEALAAINRAIQLNTEQATTDSSKDFILYVEKGYILDALKRYSEAEAVYTEAIGLKPSDINYTNRGAARYELKNYQEAAVDFNQAIALNPSNVYAYNNRGVLRDELKNYQQAEADFNQAITLDPEDANPYNNRGIVRFKMKNYQGAEADFTKAITLDPKHASAYNNRGNIRQILKNYQGAEADYSQAITLNPKEASVYNNRGFLRRELKNYQGAEADYNQAIALNSEFALAYRNRGDVRDGLKNYQGAEADFTRAIALNPRYADAYYGRGIVRTQLKNYQQAEADYSQAIALNSEESADAYYGRGFVRFAMKNYQGAEADFTKAIALNPNNAKAYYGRGVLRGQLKNYQGAEADFTKAIALNLNNANAYLDNAKAYRDRGICRTELKNYQGAEADFTKAIALNPESADAYYDRGNLRYKQGDLQGAIADYNQAIRISPNSADAHTNIGLVKYETGDVEGAINQWQAAVDIDNKAAEPHLALAVAIYTKGEREQGLKLGEEALRLDRRFANSQFLKDNNWGDHLIANTQEFLKAPRIQALLSEIH